MNTTLARTIAGAATFTALFSVGLHAQPAGPKFVKAAPTAPKSVQAGKQFTMAVSVSIDTPYHIQGNPAKDGYIPTEMEVGPLKGFKVDRVTYPKPMETTFSGEKLPVYEGKVAIKVDITPDRNVKKGRYTLPILLKYQGCDESKCFPPSSLPTRAVITVVSGAKSK